MAMEVKNGVFVLPVEVTGAGTQNKYLQTQNTYVDKNIQVEVTTPDGVLEAKTIGAVTATASIDSNIYTSDTVTNYPITIKADATVGATQIGVKTEGFVDSTDVVDIDEAKAETSSKTVYIKAGSLKGTGSASAEGGNGLELGSETTTAPTSGFYIKASAAGGASVEAAGWVDSTTPSVSVDGDSYYTIDSAALANSATTGRTYTEQEGPVLVSGDYLYINKGYIGDTKISLADLVPDGSNVKAGENSNLIYNTVSVYDNDGNLVAGTMGDASHSLSSSELNITNAAIKEVTFGKSAGSSPTLNISVTGNATITSAVDTAGYIKTTDGKSQTANYDSILIVNQDLITVDTEINFNSNAVAAESLALSPEFAKDSSSAAAAGEITTTAPSSGHYVAISVSADTQKAEINPIVTGAGYGDTDHFYGSGKVLDISLTGQTAYIPLTEAAHTIAAEASAVTPATATVTSNIVSSTGNTLGGILTAAPESGSYIIINADATTTAGSVTTNAKCTSTEGYITASAQTLPITESVSITKTAAQTKYIKIYDGTVYENSIN